MIRVCIHAAEPAFHFPTKTSVGGPLPPTNNRRLSENAAIALCNLLVKLIHLKVKGILIKLNLLAAMKGPLSPFL